ncbi:MAG: CDP-diacylglycerol--serine O-phosphatidyltransferase [Crocinitomix sp.]|nr:CDP-diacylglycerol--serine O-phosphatidyltransferase [Crocinitomix sp.]
MNAIKRLIPNLFTAGNLVGGILAIIFALNGRIDIAPFFIFASAIFDFLDGFMARILKVPSEMGKQLDSLADMVTFGVAPGIIVFVMMQSINIVVIEDSPLIQSENSPVIEFFAKVSNAPMCPMESLGSNTVMISPPEPIPEPAPINDGGFIMKYFPYLAFLIPVFALFRLAKFNLDTRQSDSFIGLPTPAMTLFFAVMPLLITSAYYGLMEGEYHFHSWQVEMADFLLNPIFLCISTIIFSILMVVELPLFALKFKDFKFKGNEIRYIFLTISILLLATLFFWAIPLIIILYVILSLINTQIAK